MAYLHPSFLNGQQRNITAGRAHELLHSIRRFSFADPRYELEIVNVLTELAFWGSVEHNHVVAVAWIMRLSAEASKLPPSSILYGKSFRRLRTICGRTDPLPDIFDFRFHLYDHRMVSSVSAVNSDVLCARSGHQWFAVKTIRSDEENRPQQRRNFRKEAVVWQLLRHPHVVPFAGVVRANPYASVQLVSEWMVNGELTPFLVAHPEEDTIRYIRHVVSGLAFIHSLEMVHADLKGRNVLVDEYRRARIADFGHTVTMRSTGLPTSTLEQRHGTVAFVAPELMDDDGGTPVANPSAASDIYALGILVWEVFAGHDPHLNLRDYAIQVQVLFRGLRPKREDAKELRRSRYNNLWGMVERAWARNPSERCTLLELHHALV